MYSRRSSSLALRCASVSPCLRGAAIGAAYALNAELGEVGEGPLRLRLTAARVSGQPVRPLPAAAAAGSCQHRCRCRYRVVPALAAAFALKAGAYTRPIFSSI